jgi:hypothetical protein
MEGPKGSPRAEYHVEGSVAFFKPL